MDGNTGTNKPTDASGSGMEGTVTVEQGIALNSFEELYSEKMEAEAKAAEERLRAEAKAAEVKAKAELEAKLKEELGVEAADEAMTRAYQRWADVQTYDNPGGWVYRVAMNWARTKLRRSKRELPSVYVTDKPHIEDPQFEPKLDAALAELPEKYRAPVVLRYYMDWSMEEISDSLGIPKGTVKSRIHRGVAALQKSLGEAT